MPAGEGLFGSAAQDGLRRDFFHTVPLHPVRTEGFLISRHETTFDDLVAAPGATLAGQGENIVHRSGAQLAVGGQYHWVDLIPNVEFFRRLDTGVDLSAAYMPASEGPGLYIGVEVWSSINVGRERS